MKQESIARNNSAGYKAVLKQKEFMKLVAANIINRFGDSIDAIAFTWLVYTITNSAAWSAIIFGVNKLPTIILQPFAGALVENMNKKRIMILTDVIRGICVSTIAVLFVLHLLNPWILLVVTALISCAESFRNPASTALLPNILNKECYDFGLSLNTASGSIVELVGLACAGGVIGILGIEAAIFIDAVTFWGSAFIISFMNTGEVKKKYEKINMKDYQKTLLGGFIYVKQKQIILNIVLLAMVTNGILVPLNALQAPLVKSILKQSEFMLSVISFSLAVGMVVGSALYPYISSKFKSRTLIFISGTFMSIYFLLLTACGNINDEVLIIYTICSLSSFLTGIGVSILISILNIQFMKQVDDEYLARAGAILNAGCVVAMPAVSFVVSILTKFLSVSTIFYFVGVVGIVFFVFIYIKKIQFES